MGKTCCCCCLWLPLPWRPPRPSGIRMWFRMCTTSTLLPMPTVSTLTLLATRCTMLQDTLETWLPVPSGLFHFPMSRTQRPLFRLPPPPVEGPLRAQLVLAPALSVEVIFSQNTLKDVLCGNNGGLTINLKGSGMKTGNKYKLYVDSAGLTTCLLPTATRKEIVEITAPVVGVDNGINVYMCTD